MTAEYGAHSPEEVAALDALRALVRIPTVSDRDPARQDPAPFDALLAELANRFPRLHETAELTRIGGHGLLLRWSGRSADRPVVLMAHSDVVPVEADAPWQHPPFAAELHDGAVWGRGTLDDKGCLAAICSAVEQHLAAGLTPAQDVWLSFGADEEVFGSCAGQAVAALRERGVRPWFVLDEGGAVAHGAFPGVAAPVAVIGVAEKGTASLRLVAEGRGGHASTPARRGPTWRIARAVSRLERTPMPTRLPEATLALLQRLAPHLPLPLRGLLRRADRVQPLIVRALLAAGPEPAAMTRTTIAATTLSGSPALNVIASRATVGLNVRILPGDTVDDVRAHVRRTVRDRSLTLETVEAGEASPVSPWAGPDGASDPAFGLLHDVIGEHFPDAVVSPYVMMAATDSRHFAAISDRVYRFAPFRMTRAQRESIHSYDEHLGIDDYLAGVAWYRTLIERLPG